MMKNSIIYIFGKPGTGKTFLSDEIENGFLSNDSFDSVPVDDSNLEETISNLNQYKNTLLIIQSNLLTKIHLKAFKNFVEDKKFERAVVIQSGFQPDPEFENFCLVYETGYPYFAWVTNIGDGLWEAKAVKTEKTVKAYGKVQTCELVRDYKTNGSNQINRESI